LSTGWRRSSYRQLLPWETLLAAAIVTPVALAVHGLPAARWDAPLVLMLLYAAVPGTALAYWAVAVANRRLPAVTTSLGLLGVPIISIVTATLALGEALTPSLLAAVALVIGGVAVGTIGGAGRRAEGASRF
jgi:drug/metabolite transporter (DMT)-like permease